MYTCYWCGLPTISSYGHWNEPGVKDCWLSNEFNSIEKTLITYNRQRINYLAVPPPSGWVTWNASQARGSAFRVVLATDGLLYNVNPMTDTVIPMPGPNVSTLQQAIASLPVIPAPAKAPPRPCKFKPGDKVRWQNKPYLLDAGLSYGTVVAVVWDDSLSLIYGYKIITTKSTTFGFEDDLELNAPVKPAYDAPISLKVANARPKHPKMPCCGYCGEPVVSIYTASRGIVRGCDAHGPGVPEITLNKEQHP